MTRYKKGDVILVPFPFSDQTTAKKRPAVIISSDAYNNTSQDLVIMAITGQTRSRLVIGEFLIEDWQGAGLLKSSAVKSAISTIERRLVMKLLGNFSSRDLATLEKALKELLDLKSVGDGGP
jgi:mRNA interferase MazF